MRFVLGSGLRWDLWLGLRQRIEDKVLDSGIYSKRGQRLQGQGMERRRA